MKMVINTFARLTAIIVAMLFSVVMYAQETGGADVDVNINKKGGDWYTQLWVWIVGGAVFILLLVALLRGGGRRDV